MERQPKGELVIKTLAMPADTNVYGDIFGGWIMSQMDLGASILANKVADSRTVTVAADAMSFISPARVGDAVSCYARLIGIGKTSMKIGVEVWVSQHGLDTPRCVTEGIFTYVAIDDNGKPRAVERS